MDERDQKPRATSCLRRDVNHPLENWFTCSSSTAAPSLQSTPISAAANRGKGKGVVRATQYRRPRVMEICEFQAENGVTTFNPGLPSQRIVSARPRKIIRSADVTGDIGFKPTSGLKQKETLQVPSESMNVYLTMTNNGRAVISHSNMLYASRDRVIDLPWKMEGNSADVDRNVTNILDNTGLRQSPMSTEWLGEKMMLLKPREAEEVLMHGELRKKARSCCSVQRSSYAGVESCWKLLLLYNELGRDVATGLYFMRVVNVAQSEQLTSRDRVIDLPWKMEGNSADVDRNVTNILDNTGLRQSPMSTEWLVSQISKINQ
ncbi:hypothetical protein RND71_009820 [Anisodus tanguticus]|uniref:Uncharacterized protein n=1 Tax=Anisodus tanguticus TaxID=243964 RepID=A0AAE1VS71_9SOLA|nr:hypothetical protein RND71_009820 [Anisodus tanguticus]